MCLSRCVCPSDLVSSIIIALARSMACVGSLAVCNGGHNRSFALDDQLWPQCEASWRNTWPAEGSSVLGVLCFAVGFYAAFRSPPRSRSRAKPKRNGSTVRFRGSDDVQPADSARSNDGHQEEHLASHMPIVVARRDAPLSTSSEAFGRCLLHEDDIDVVQFMHACRDYTHILKSIGKFTQLAAREVHSNMDKVQAARDSLLERLNNPRDNVDRAMAKCTLGRSSGLRSMRVLLGEEREGCGHSADLGVSDPSAAMGLLWARRGLHYWLMLFSSVIEEAEKDRFVTGSGVPAALAAYTKTLEPHQGPLGRQMFRWAANTTPSWEDMSARLAPSASDAEFVSDVRLWLATIEVVITRMGAIQAELDLEDLRKSF